MSAEPLRAVGEPLSDAMVKELEDVAVELARVAGAEMVTGLGRILKVRYKGGSESEQLWRDPVSEVDSRIEQLIRIRLAERFPDHDILGEESEERPGRGSDFIWAIDPIDGTTNFINGFPAFAASIGVLYEGRPVVGALWCAATHALRAGVYHSRPGGPLHFDDETIEPRQNAAIRRRLAGEPHLAPDASLPWEVRKTGSAAIECAFVAAGLLRVARFERPNVWDIAGGLALVRAASGDARVLGPDGWVPFDSFEATAAEGGDPDIRNWRREIIIGEAEAVELLCKVRPRKPAG